MKNKEIVITFVDGMIERIGPKRWDDYEYLRGLFVVKRKKRWIAIYNMECVKSIVVI